MFLLLQLPHLLECTDRYPADRMKQLVEGLHANGQHWIAITDAGVAADQGYAAYEEGERDSVFIKAATGDTYMGQVRVCLCLCCCWLAAAAAAGFGCVFVLIGSSSSSRVWQCVCADWQ